MALFSCVEESIFCWFLLTLTHGDVSEFFVKSGDIELGCDTLNFGRWVDSREQNKEDWNTVVGLGESFENAERRLLNILFAHHLTDKRC